MGVRSLGWLIALEFFDKRWSERPPRNTVFVLFASTVNRMRTVCTDGIFYVDDIDSEQSNAYRTLPETP